MSDGSEDDEATASGELLAPKKTSRSIRVLTVLAYVLSVSLAAILLSLYYVFLWDPKMPGAMRRVAELPPPCQPLPPERYAMLQAHPPTPPIIEYLTRPGYGPQRVGDTRA